MVDSCGSYAYGAVCFVLEHGVDSYNLTKSGFP